MSKFISYKDGDGEFLLPISKIERIHYYKNDTIHFYIDGERIARKDPGGYCFHHLYCFLEHQHSTDITPKWIFDIDHSIKESHKLHKDFEEMKKAHEE